jgi:acyl dehydratase
MRIGDKAGRTRTVTVRDIELFSELTGDRNPLHYDVGAASASRFGGIIVQGGITSGLLNAVVAHVLPGPYPRNHHHRSNRQCRARRYRGRLP